MDVADPGEAERAVVDDDGAGRAGVAARVVAQLGGARRELHRERARALRRALHGGHGELRGASGGAVEVLVEHRHHRGEQQGEAGRGQERVAGAPLEPAGAQRDHDDQREQGHHRGGSPVHVVDFDRYRLRLGLECLLVGTEERTRRAFNVYSAELVRDDETICATAEVGARAGRRLRRRFWRVVCRPTPVLLDHHGGPVGHPRHGSVFSASRGSRTEHLDLVCAPPIDSRPAWKDRPRLVALSGRRGLVGSR